MSKRDPYLLIQDILESSQKIMLYTGDMSFASFLEDAKTVDAVIRNFEVIGEAANRLPDDFKSSFDHIDWHKIRGFRNRIVHDYMGIDYQIVWEIKTHYLPKLIIALQSIRF